MLVHQPCHPERALVSARLQLHIHHLLTDFYHLGSNACVFTGARECRKGVHTAFIDINAPRCAALLARAGGDLGRLSGDFQDCHRGVRGKSCVLRAKAMCMLVWLVPIRSGDREQRSVARYFPCC